MKRLFDITVSIVALIILLPLFIPVIIILKFTGEGKVFYRQLRIGKNNEPFYITKFATMLKDSPNIGTLEHTLRDDPRVLPFGKFLRKSKINELPQIWDILVGKMSWVGPRPTTPSHHDAYPSFYNDVMMDNTPGITGIGSIIFRDEEEVLSRAVDHDYCYINEVVPYKAALEKWYKENRTFFMDIVIMLLTAWIIIHPESKSLFNLYPTIPNIDLKAFGKKS